MDTDPTDAAELEDYDLNQALETEELEGLSLQRQRLARIEEYREEALNRSDPFAAIIGCGNADLQEIFDHCSAVILDVLNSGPGTLEAFRDVAPEIRLLATLRGAIATDFAVQELEAERQGSPFPRRVQADPRTAPGKRTLVAQRRSANR